MTKADKARANHREVEVLEALRQMGGSARNANLADLLNVSEETIRRTTKALAKADLVRRVHGGAYLATAEAGKGVFSRLGRRTDEKTLIAEAAAAVIPDGSCIFLDTGSTTAFVALALRKHQNLTVVTNALTIAQSLADQDGLALYLAGGELRRNEWGAFGPETLRFIERFRFDFAVLGVDGVDLNGGFLLASAEAAAVARAAMGQARRTMIVADHLKFGKTAPLILCQPQAVDAVVTDRPLAPAFARRFGEWDVATVGPDAGGAGADYCLGPEMRATP